MTSTTPDVDPAAQRFAARVALTRPATASHVPAALPATSALAPLFAPGRDPLTVAGETIRSALLACQDAVEAVAGETDLREAFEYACRQLDLAARMTAETQLTAPATYVGAPGGTPVLDDAPRLDQPVATSREPLYGLRATLRGALSYLADSVRDLGAVPRRGVGPHVVLPVVATTASAARRIERVADVVVAHVLEGRRPGTPSLPGVGGDVELYAAGRAAPLRRAALRARVRFTPGRVEVTTATGRISVGQDSPIGGLLWVAPGTTSSLVDALDPRERDIPSPEQDELGSVHVLDTDGRSLLSLAVADWASQPTTVVDQQLVDRSSTDVPLGVARGIIALEALGFTRGASTIGVPLRRGLAHPPDAPGTLGRLRSAPSRPGYAPRDATALRAGRRRARRLRFYQRDLGPTLAWSWPLRAIAPTLLAIAPLLVWPGAWTGWFSFLVVVLTLAVLLEPYLVAGWHLLRDTAVPVKASARYKVGRSPFAPRLELRGSDLVLTSRSGHRTRLPGPSDGDLGVVRIVRLRSGGTWGFALADSRWHWRAVLPAAEWTPGGRFTDLEGFAAQVGLELADQEVAPLPRLAQETVAPGPAAAQRWFGVWPRGLVILGFYALPAALLSIVGPARSLNLAIAELALTFGGAAVFAALARLRFGRAARA